MRFLTICLIHGLLAAHAIAADGPNARVRCWLETSLERVFPNSPPGSTRMLDLVTARNRRLSFQACLRNPGTGMLRVRASVEHAMIRRRMRMMP